MLQSKAVQSPHTLLEFCNEPVGHEYDPSEVRIDGPMPRPLQSHASCRPHRPTHGSPDLFGRSACTDLALFTLSLFLFLFPPPLFSCFFPLKVTYKSIFPIQPVPPFYRTQTIYYFGTCCYHRRYCCFSVTVNRSPHYLYLLRLFLCCHSCIANRYHFQAKVSSCSLVQETITPNGRVRPMTRLWVYQMLHSDAWWPWGESYESLITSSRLDYSHE